MLIFVIWIGLSLLVAISGKDKKIGYWGVFFLSLLLSPLIGLIIGLVSGNAQKTFVQSWKCTKCGQPYTGMLKECPNCKIAITYPDSAYDNIRYTCGYCKKIFFGRKPNCPHCNKTMIYN